MAAVCEQHFSHALGLINQYSLVGLIFLLLSMNRPSPLLGYFSNMLAGSTLTSSMRTVIYIIFIIHYEESYLILFGDLNSLVGFLLDQVLFNHSSALYGFISFRLMPFCLCSTLYMVN